MLGGVRERSRPLFAPTAGLSMPAVVSQGGVVTPLQGLVRASPQRVCNVVRSVQELSRKLGGAVWVGSWRIAMIVYPMSLLRSKYGCGAGKLAERTPGAK